MHTKCNKFKMTQYWNILSSQIVLTPMETMKTKMYTSKFIYKMTFKVRHYYSYYLSVFFSLLVNIQDSNFLILIVCFLSLSDMVGNQLAKGCEADSSLFFAHCYIVVCSFCWVLWCKLADWWLCNSTSSTDMQPTRLGYTERSTNPRHSNLIIIVALEWAREHQLEPT